MTATYGLLLTLFAVVAFGCWRVGAGVRRDRWVVEDAQAEAWLATLRELPPLAALPVPVARVGRCVGCGTVGRVEPSGMGWLCADVAACTRRLTSGVAS